MRERHWGWPVAGRGMYGADEIQWAVRAAVGDAFEGLDLPRVAAGLAILVALHREGLALVPDELEPAMPPLRRALDRLDPADPVRRSIETHLLCLVDPVPPLGGRPPFADERGVERWLRERGAPYDTWMWASAFGDDLAATWAACEDAQDALAIACASDLGRDRIVSAVSRAFLEQLRDAPGAGILPAARYGRLAKILGRWRDTGVAWVDDDQAEWFTTQRRAISEHHDALHRRGVRDRTWPAACDALFRATGELIDGPQHLAADLPYLERSAPDLAPRLKRALDREVRPFVVRWRPPPDRGHVV